MTDLPFRCSVFHLAVNGADCRAELLVNGFPILEANFSTSVAMAPVINPFLLDGLNSLSLRITYVRFRPPVLSRTATVSAAVLEYPRGERRPHFDQAVTLSRVELTPERVHQLYETSDSIDIPFRARCIPAATTYLAARPIESAARVESARARLDVAMAERDEDALMTLFAPKVRDYAASLGGSEDSVRESLRGVLLDGYFRLGLAPAEHNRLRMSSFAGGRLWEIARPDGPYLVTNRDVDGGRYAMRIFVAETEQGIGIVR